MYKIDRRGGAGGVQKSFSRTDPTAAISRKFLIIVETALNIYSSWDLKRINFVILNITEKKLPQSSLLLFKHRTESR